MSIDETVEQHLTACSSDRLRPTRLKSSAVAVLIAAVLMVGCSEKFVREPANVCEFLLERRGWYKDITIASERWQVPVSLMMSIVKHESHFDADARPPRRRILGFIPGRRRSSAYGYAQALDSTWQSYIDETGNRGADRDDFGDAVDFIGWYVDGSARSIGIPRNDGFGQYLAYHEGRSGFQSGSWKAKGWLRDTAQRVQREALDYNQQLVGCDSKARERRWSWWPFG